MLPREFLSHLFQVILVLSVQSYPVCLISQVYVQDQCWDLLFPLVEISLVVLTVVSTVWVFVDLGVSQAGISYLGLFLAPTQKLIFLLFLLSAFVHSV